MKTKWSDTSLDSEEKSGALLHRNKYVKEWLTISFKKYQLLAKEYHSKTRKIIFVQWALKMMIMLKLDSHTLVSEPFCAFSPFRLSTEEHPTVCTQADLNPGHTQALQLLII